MTAEQLSQIIKRIQLLNADLAEEKLNEAKDFHSVLYNNGNDYWDFKFADLYSSGVGIFTDHLNQELILTPEEIKAVYINYIKE